jgi:hypothetical protein
VAAGERSGGLRVSLSATSKRRSELTTLRADKYSGNQYHCASSIHRARTPVALVNVRLREPRLIRLSTLVAMEDGTHSVRMHSQWCAWCGKPVTVGVVIAAVVLYHDLCWERRACLIEPAKSN